MQNLPQMEIFLGKLHYGPKYGDFSFFFFFLEYGEFQFVFPKSIFCTTCSCFFFGAKHCEISPTKNTPNLE
jgi:hypothetical protein